MNKPQDATVSAAAVPRASGYSIMGHIFGSHLERIGVFRTVAGAIPQYFIIPALIVIHVTLAVVLYQWLLRPLLGTKRVRWADHVIVDRHRIREMTWFDKFNCMFCGYANGLCTMINKELDQAAEMSAPVAMWKRPLLFMVCVAALPAYLFFEICFIVVYDVLVATALGYHRISMRQAWTVLKEKPYAPVHGFLFRTWLRVMKSVMLRFSGCLDQIESSWCPLRHFETRAGVVYPDHHKNFFGPDELEKMREMLRTVGTVSDRKPLY